MNVLNELRLKNDLFDLIFSQIKIGSSRNSEWHESLYRQLLKCALECALPTSAYFSSWFVFYSSETATRTSDKKHGYCSLSRFCVQYYQSFERRAWWWLNGGAVAGHQVQLDWSLFGRTCIINLNNIGNCHSGQIPGV